MCRRGLLDGGDDDGTKRFLPPEGGSHGAMMKVLLVEPAYDHPLPSLFIMKAMTYWRMEGEEVVATRGMGIETEEPDLIQITFPIWSWAFEKGIATVKFYQGRYPKAEIQIGGVMATLHEKLVVERTGIKPHLGPVLAIEESRPDYTYPPSLRCDVAQVRAWIGCPKDCDFCMVTKAFGARLIPVRGWRSHWDASKRIWQWIDDNASVAPPEWWEETADFFQAVGHKVDQNSGNEPRWMTDRKTDALVRMPMSCYRTAFDEKDEEKFVRRFIEMLLQRGVPPSKIHCYLLFGFKDDIEDALYRFDILWGEYHVMPFAMRMVPLDWSGGRWDYCPPHWERPDLINFARYVNQKKMMKKMTWKQFKERAS